MKNLILFLFLFPLLAHATNLRETIDANVVINGDLTVQSDVDSTTGVRFLDNDGGTPVLTIDTVNERVGVRTSIAPDSLLEVNGGIGTAIETITTHTTLNETHSTVLVQATGNVIIFLPTSASSFNNTDGIGRIYTIKKWDADTDKVTVDGANSEEIDGATTAIITIQFQSITIQSTGNEWIIL